MKEMEVTKVALDLELKTPVVLLKERKGARIFPIWIGLSEARVIALIMKGLSTSYSTFDLAKKLIEKFKAQVDKVIINELKSNIYYAKIFIKMSGKILEIDARPSDAIALALKFKAPIYVDEDRIAVREKPIEDKEIDEFKKKLKDIKPEDFSF
ncbi:bifunctional nuclease family protein [Candidatus Aerophobetes bacterium]|uniref:Bifunctional nuclease family protein n=1 Tax=Aerophobetes bacterium TaxID=2030807 RepID=A0A497E313_UNCAE|nr:MAG: bifunctional nuclease family protein [Candidatus Aerophobetes bacterium]